MAGSVTFILKDPRAEVKTPIYLVFWYGQTRIKVSTGERIHPKNWLTDKFKDKEKGTVKRKSNGKARETKDNPDGSNINTRLNTHEINVLNAVRDHLNQNGTIDPVKLKNELVTLLRPVPVKKEEPMTLFRCIEDFKNTTTRAVKTKVSYQSTLNTLKDYNATLRKDLTFEDINMDFYESFVNYLTTVKKFVRNTIGRDIKNIKVFMNYALDKGYTQNRGHLHRKFKRIEETAETIYLTDSELSLLYEKDLSNNPKLDRVRDIFLIGCYTGLRFSDLSQLTPDKIINNGTRLKVKTVKTGETVIIPLHWTIKEILKKYEGRLPRTISNQKFNEYLKKLGEEAKIKAPVPVTKKTGGLSLDKTLEKFNLITTHTARRSFATNMFLAEVPSISIMKITGHRTERAFMKYIKITQEQNAEKLEKHKYFIKPMKVVKKPQKKAVNQ